MEKGEGQPPLSSLRSPRKRPLKEIDSDCERNAFSPQAPTSHHPSSQNRVSQRADRVESQNRTVLHVDVDSFYTSAECLRDPYLRGRPLAVRQGNGGGFVAVSYEARRHGIRKGDGAGAGARANIAKLRDRMGEAETRCRCPEEDSLVIRDMDMEYYRKCSEGLLRQIEEVCGAGAIAVEKASIDDFFVLLDEKKSTGEPGCKVNTGSCVRTYLATTIANRRGVECVQWDTALANLQKDAAASGMNGGVHVPPHPIEDEGESDDENDVVHDYDMEECHPQVAVPAHPNGDNLVWAVALAQRLRQRLDLPVSIGIAGNKCLAKLVGGLNKPGGITVLHPAAVDGILCRTPLRKLPGFRGKLGEALEGFLSANASVYDLRFLADAHLQNLATTFGMARVRGVRELGHGIDRTEVVRRGPPKTIMAERSFPPGKDFCDFARTLSEQLVRRLVMERSGDWPRRLVFKWRHGHTSLSTTGSRTVAAPPGLAERLANMVQVRDGREETGDDESSKRSDEEPSSSHTNTSSAPTSAAPLVASLCISVVPAQDQVTRLVVGALGFESGISRTNTEEGAMARYLLLEKQNTSHMTNNKHMPAEKVVGATHDTVVPATEPTTSSGPSRSPLSSKSKMEISCPICSVPLLKKNANAHVESHFASASAFDSNLVRDNPKHRKGKRKGAPDIQSFFQPRQQTERE